MDSFFDHIESFFINSNSNGFGLGIVVVLFYLSIYHFILYVKSRERFYLFYSLYAILNVVNVFKRIKGSYVEDLFELNPQFFLDMSLPLQFLSYVIFSFFVVSILRFKTHFPKFYIFFKKYTIGLSMLFFGTVFLFVFYDFYRLMQSVYILIFLPSILIFMVYGGYLALKSKDPVRYYIVIGYLILGIASFLLFYLIHGKPLEEGSDFFYLYYTAVLIENFLYTYSIAIKQKSTYEERILIYHQLLEKLQENERLKEKLNAHLSSQIEFRDLQISGLEKDKETQRIQKVKALYEREITELHLRSLRSQMNPHFIFNALNSIKVFLIDQEKDRAILYLNRFSKLIRLVLEGSRKTKISLGEELEIAKLYLTLESIRFEDGIELKMEIAEDVRLHEIELPPLLLQPFFENAIWHGLMNKAGEKWINVELKKQEGDHILSIRDNGIGRKASQEINAKRTLKKESIGMSLSKDRLELFNQNERVYYHFEIIDHEDDQIGPSGTEVIFYLETAR